MFRRYELIVKDGVLRCNKKKFELSRFICTFSHVEQNLYKNRYKTSGQQTSNGMMLGEKKTKTKNNGVKGEKKISKWIFQKIHDSNVSVTHWKSIEDARSNNVKTIQASFSLNH